MGRWMLVGVGMLLASLAHASLGDTQEHVDADRMAWGMRHAHERGVNADRHTLRDGQGTLIREYVGVHGRVFAVAWQAGFKPDLTKLLGDHAAETARAMKESARRGGVQRQFLHQGHDLVVFSSGYLNQFRGYAYRPSLVPPGFDLSRLGRDGAP